MTLVEKRRVARLRTLALMYSENKQIVKSLNIQIDFLTSKK